MDNEFILQDRIQKIQQIIKQYGAENFAVSFSGGKDSTVVSELLDLAIPNNKIPRVYANTGIELDLIEEFVKNKQKSDSRIKIIKPTLSIKETLEKYGYPFKSKIHSHCVNLYQTDPSKNMWKGYTGQRPEYWHSKECPKKLRYQFTSEFNIKISDKCCYYMKEKPLENWAKENNKKYTIIGIMKEEGGRRTSSKCLIFSGKKLKRFQPLVPITKEWEDWFIEKYNVKICNIYKQPYNFTRTGCKGCPFAIHLQKELDTLEEFFPNERKQCEYIWEPIYKEYRRINYRLKGE